MHPVSDDIAPENARLIATWFEDATAAAHALGIDVDLPDVGNQDPDYWQALDRKAWRDALKGKVDSTDDEIDHGDPDWVRLKRISGPAGPAGEPDLCDTIEVWFDLEEGVRFRFCPRSAARLTAILRQAAALNGLRLSDAWPGNVIAMISRFGRGLPEPDDISPIMEASGWSRDGEISWVLVP